MSAFLDGWDAAAAALRAFADEQPTEYPSRRMVAEMARIHAELLDITRPTEQT